ncbi:DUF5683 domain-containing protein [Methanimicrococcus sp. OttesenSCG-928-J09]|nr:DUF5683 domain-containing protein [Methanimicrococcus sp. OttesenSCG-928-J09]
MSQNYCSNCGEPLKEYAIVCSNCGMPAKEQGTHEKTESASNHSEHTDNTEHFEETVHAEQVYEKRPKADQPKNTFLAVIFSFFIPGLGQVYNGKFWKGVLFMAATFIGSILIIPGLVIWIYGMYEAYKEAEKINNGELPYTEPSVWEIIIFLVLPILAAIAIVLFIFVFFLAIAVPLSIMA